METKHSTQTFLYNMQDSKVVSRNNEKKFTLDMKSCHFTRNQTYQRMRWRQCKNNNVLHENI
jgi:tRNA G37 N-methylase Trm5